VSVEITPFGIQGKQEKIHKAARKGHAAGSMNTVRTIFFTEAYRKKVIETSEGITGDSGESSPERKKQPGGEKDVKEGQERRRFTEQNLNSCEPNNVPMVRTLQKVKKNGARRIF